MTNPRSITLEVLDRVLYDGAYSHIALSAAIDKSDMSDRDRGLATELVYGILARKRTIDALLKGFVNRPLDELDRPVILTLRMAIYQLLFLDRIPEHAAVNEAVELAKAQCGRGAGGFVNGVLRTMLRTRHRWHVWEQVDPEAEPVRYLGLRHSLPDWISELLIDDHGFGKALKIAEELNASPPLYFRTLDEEFPVEETEDEVIDLLPQGLERVPLVPGAFRSEEMTEEIAEAVKEKKLVVQDLGSQLVSLFGTPKNAKRILDGCAGLGGKTLHLAKLSPKGATVVAVDPQRSKLKQLKETAKGTSFEDKIETLQVSLERLSDDRNNFDLVLVDAPCTGLGVIRRHPETRWRRTEKDVQNRSKLQQKLIAEAAKKVRPGGLLIYSVCTFTYEEGPAVIGSFLSSNPDFSREKPAQKKKAPLQWSNFLDEDGEMRLNPVDHGADIFYAARLRRKS